MKQWYTAAAVAIVYLVVSLAFKAWQWSWILWIGYGCIVSQKTGSLMSKF